MTVQLHEYLDSALLYVHPKGQWGYRVSCGDSREDLADRIGKSQRDWSAVSEHAAVVVYLRQREDILQDDLKVGVASNDVNVERIRYFATRVRLESRDEAASPQHGGSGSGRFGKAAQRDVLLAVPVEFDIGGILDPYAGEFRRFGHDALES